MHASSRLIYHYGQSFHASVYDTDDGNDEVGASRLLFRHVATTIYPNVSKNTYNYSSVNDASLLTVEWLSTRPRNSQQ